MQPTKLRQTDSTVKSSPLWSFEPMKWWGSEPFELWCFDSLCFSHLCLGICCIYRSWLRRYNNYISNIHHSYLWGFFFLFLFLLGSLQCLRFSHTKTHSLFVLPLYFPLLFLVKLERFKDMDVNVSYSVWLWFNWWTWCLNVTRNTKPLSQFLTRNMRLCFKV